MMWNTGITTANMVIIPWSSTTWRHIVHIGNHRIQIFSSYEFDNLTLIAGQRYREYFKYAFGSCLVSFLGVGFFTGIQSCGPDMLKTLDNYYDENNVYDIEIISNLGLTNNDIEEMI